MDLAVWELSSRKQSASYGCIVGVSFVNWNHWELELGRADRTAILRINRPEARNAINREAMGEFEEILDVLSDNGELGCVVLTGEGDRAFIAGGDLKDFSRLDSPESGQEMSARMQALLNRWEALPVPTIAAIGANAYGGGCEVALACDIRVMAQGTHLVFSQARLGLLTGWGGACRLVQCVGKARAMLILTTGEYLKAEEARDMGLVAEVAPEGFALAHALDIARKIVRHPRPAISAMKGAVLAAVQLESDAAQKVENDWFRKRWNSEEHRAAVAQFLGTKDNGDEQEEGA